MHFVVTVLEGLGEMVVAILVAIKVRWWLQVSLW